MNIQTFKKMWKRNDNKKKEKRLKKIGVVIKGDINVGVHGNEKAEDGVGCDDADWAVLINCISNGCFVDTMASQA